VGPRGRDLLGRHLREIGQHLVGVAARGGNAVAVFDRRAGQMQRRTHDTDLAGGMVRNVADHAARLDVRVGLDIRGGVDGAGGDLRFLQLRQPFGARARLQQGAHAIE